MKADDSEAEPPDRECVRTGREAQVNVGAAFELGVRPAVGPVRGELDAVAVDLDLRRARRPGVVHEHAVVDPHRPVPARGKRGARQAMAPGRPLQLADLGAEAGPLPEHRREEVGHSRS